MDTNKLITNIRTRFEHHQSRIYLQEKYKNRLTIVDQNGTWDITPEFISALKNLESECILLDMHNRPVLVDTKKLHKTAITTYNSVMESWLKEFTDLENKR